uniref:protein-glutamine gamma-glutamyltransferase n=1 Tax=Mastacembelus armatus TaxID=205130 RepID=A0A3Q3LQG3_9TELE
MCLEINKPNHYTSAYDINNLVVRRGQEFIMKVTFSRPLTDSDDFQVEFLIGSDPSPNKGSLVVVTFTSRPGGPWSGRILQTQDQLLVLGITPTPNAIVGKFLTYVAVVMSNGLLRTKRDATTDLYLLFNPWCQQDAVFLSDEAARTEYVLNDNGVIYQGSADAVTQRSWVYGQFERGILDACIYILDVSQMPIRDRGDVIKLVRQGSAMINSQDDNGVIVGNWSNDFSLGKAPTSWTGSVSILLQYVNTGVPVCFGQCWVYAGVFNTFLRCLGIPARVITNFNSAHDNGGNLKTDLIFKSDGSQDRRSTRDSIWNFHCWNEAFMVRPDLPPGLSGWQVVDSTPQETSDGFYRCGPASVTAIKEGLLCHPFDLGFVFAEVNSDVVMLKEDRYGSLTPFNVDKTYIGKALYTKAIGNMSPVDITYTYKYPEGTYTAAESKLIINQSKLYLHRIRQSIDCKYLSQPDHGGLGCDVKASTKIRNICPKNRPSNVSKTVSGHLTGAVVFYTGVTANHFTDQDFTVTVAAKRTESVMFKITAQEYLPQMGTELSMKFIVTVQDGENPVNTMKVIELQKPKLTLTVSGTPRVMQQMYVTVSFINNFNFYLENATLTMEGPGLMNPKSRFYRTIAPQASISWKESFIPRLDGQQRLTAVLDCKNLRIRTEINRPSTPANRLTG